MPSPKMVTSRAPKMKWFQVFGVFVALLALAVGAEATDARPCCPGDNILSPKGCSGYEKKLNSSEPKFSLLTCDQGSYLVNPREDSAENFTVSQDGVLMITTEMHYMEIESDRYCLSKMKLESSLDPVALVCFNKETRSIKYVLIASLTVVSVGFLLLTIVVYSVVAELRDLQGKCIICACFSLALGFFFLAIANLSSFSLQPLCTANGFMMYYWIMASFFWMNIISTNVFRSIVFWDYPVADRKYFICYTIYGWGVPLALLLTALIANYVDGEHIKPGIGDFSCWFTGKTATWVYFYGPIGVILVINMILFVWTSRALWKASSYNHVTTVKSLRFKFFLYLKVFLVMGIGWIFELISYIHDNDGFTLWLVMDILNCLQGLFLFLVLVLFRKRAMKGLSDRDLLCGFRLSRWTSGKDEECEEMIEELEVEPSATPMNA